MLMWDNGSSSTPFPHLYIHLRSLLMRRADTVDVGEWHAMDVKGRPELVTRELRHVTFLTPMALTEGDAKLMCEPNLPWAEDQFQERVLGEPRNPGETYKDWPWQSQMGKHVHEVFTHTYMERYWPKHANHHRSSPRTGIRYRYGDLGDVVDLLARSPYTRQAVLPVWFPEDTGGHHGGRLPCSLTYHFLRRGDQLHVEYSIRSCDFVRHFRDDVYMTMRLAHWVLTQLQTKDKSWKKVTAGTLTMHIGSLHVMEGDIRKLEREVEDGIATALS